MLDPALIEACAPTVAVETMQRVVSVESGGDPLAIGVNPGRGGKAYRLYASDIAEAVALAKKALESARSVDLGLTQVNSRNLASLGYSLEQMFNPCTNLAAGASILTDAYRIAVQTHGEGQRALRVALSYYNTGTPSRGLSNGYVDRYETGRRRQRSLPPDASLYGADPTVLDALASTGEPR